MAPREASEPGPEGQTYQQNPERGKQALHLLQNPENNENLQAMKSMVGNRSWGDILSVLRDIHLAHQQELAATEAAQQLLQDNHEALKTKYNDLKKHLKQPQQEQTSTTASNDDGPPPTGRAISMEIPEPEKKRKKFPDPEKFMNDGNPTWEDWYTDMVVKLRSETAWDEEDKMGYVLGRTGKDPRKLIQPSYLENEYDTADEMLQVLLNTYNDPHKKAKARAMYRNLKMGENERFDTFMSKFTACAAQAGITDNTMKREDLFDKVTKSLRDTMRPTLSLYPTFTDFREQLSLLYWELEAEKKRSPRPSTERSTPPTRKPNPRTTTKEEKEKERPKYGDKRKAELSLKGACFNCEQTGHMAKDCPKGDSIKVLEANEESDSESGKDDP